MSNDKKDYSVLIINGGGVRGIIPAKILQELTKISGKQIHELFDFIVGTSIGGIITTALTVKDSDGKAKYTTDDVVNIFLNESENIFPPDSISNWPYIGAIYNKFFSRYSREGIDAVLDKHLGNATFLDTIVPILTVSYSLETDKPRTWSTFKAEDIPYKNNFYLKDAAGATSAAPTYFPPKITIDKNNITRHCKSKICYKEI